MGRISFVCIWLICFNPYTIKYAHFIAQTVHKVNIIMKLYFQGHTFQIHSQNQDFSSTNQRNPLSYLVLFLKLKFYSCSKLRNTSHKLFTSHVYHMQMTSCNLLILASKKCVYYILWIVENSWKYPPIKNKLTLFPCHKCIDTELSRLGSYTVNVNEWVCWSVTF